MDDRFERKLARGLREHADRRIRPVDPARLAAGVSASNPIPSRLGPGSIPSSRRWLVLLTAGALVLGSVALGFAIGREQSPQSGSPAPHASGGSSPSAAASVDPRLTILESGSWGLDFTASGLNGHVDPSFQDEIGSSLTFRAGRFEGATGYGGGCDHFGGTYAVQGAGLRLVFDTLQQGCGHGSPQDVINRLVGTRFYDLEPCAAVAVSTSPDPNVTCLLLDSRETPTGVGLSADLLVYRHVP